MSSFLSQVVLVATNDANFEVRALFPRKRVPACYGSTRGFTCALATIRYLS